MLMNVKGNTLSKQGKENVGKAIRRRSIKCRETYKGAPHICIICNIELPWEKRVRKTCSKKCRDEDNSIRRANIILKRGTDNFKTKSSNFNYKFLSNFKCDSNLEKAGLIYLIDIFGASKIEKFKSIINFKEGDITRRFNPDFYVKKDNKIYIVEVKMKWIKTSNHPYNRTIPLKKIALQKFCNDKGFEMIWLDVDYDRRLKVIYKQVSKNEFV